MEYRNGDKVKVEEIYLYLKPSYDFCKEYYAEDGWINTEDYGKEGELKMVRQCIHCGKIVDVYNSDKDSYWTSKGNRIVYHICPECGESVEGICFN